MGKTAVDCVVINKTNLEHELQEFFLAGVCGYFTVKERGSPSPGAGLPTCCLALLNEQRLSFYKYFSPVYINHKVSISLAGQVASCAYPTITGIINLICLRWNKLNYLCANINKLHSNPAL